MNGKWKMVQYGTSYGWIVKEFKQIDTLIEQLKTNPQNRNTNTRQNPQVTRCNK